MRSPCRLHDPQRARVSRIVIRLIRRPSARANASERCRQTSRAVSFRNAATRTGACFGVEGTYRWPPSIPAGIPGRHATVTSAPRNGSRVPSRTATGADARDSSPLSQSSCLCAKARRRASDADRGAVTTGFLPQRPSDRTIRRDAAFRRTATSMGGSPTESQRATRCAQRRPARAVARIKVRTSGWISVRHFDPLNTP